MSACLVAFLTELGVGQISYPRPQHASRSEVLAKLPRTLMGDRPRAVVSAEWRSGIGVVLREGGGEETMRVRK
jgi:hypothetical protein